MSKKLFPLLMLAGVMSAHGAPVYVTNSPLAWKIEDYAGLYVVTWNTSSPCTGGLIQFGSSATPADINRFWATVSIAKTSGKRMFIRFEDSGAPANCPILSFGLDTE